MAAQGGIPAEAMLEVLNNGTGGNFDGRGPQDVSRIAEVVAKPTRKS